MIKQINFDMDGTLADFYGVDNWLGYIMESNPFPYIVAKPRVNLSLLARQIHILQDMGYEVNIISWLAKNSNSEFDELVTFAKEKWLKAHLPSVTFDNIYIVKYGTPKQTLGQGILFDDEKPNRDMWNGNAFDVDDINEVLKMIIRGI